jgi:hypothetical protein
VFLPDGARPLERRPWDAVTVRARSWRWWFEDRSTGEITVAQFPNWPLWSIGGCWTARLLSAEGSTIHDTLGWTIHGLWLFWGADEVLRGVNPWRRVLGAVVIVWQAISIAT